MVISISSPLSSKAVLSRIDNVIHILVKMYNHCRDLPWSIYMDIIHTLFIHTYIFTCDGCNILRLLQPCQCPLIGLYTFVQAMD